MTALIVALVAGAVVGLALGGLGGGGSVLAVPALIYPLGFTPAAATTAGLLIVIATSLTGLVAHARRAGSAGVPEGSSRRPGSFRPRSPGRCRYVSRPGR